MLSQLQEPAGVSELSPCGRCGLQPNTSFGLPNYERTKEKKKQANAAAAGEAHGILTAKAQFFFLLGTLVSKQDTTFSQAKKKKKQYPRCSSSRETHRFRSRRGTYLAIEMPTEHPTQTHYSVQKIKKKRKVGRAAWRANVHRFPREATKLRAITAP